MEWSQAAHAAKSEKAKHAALSRWGRGGKDAPSNAPSISQASPKQCSSNANQNQNQNQEETPPLSPSPKPKHVSTPEGVDQQAWSDFTAHRREIRKPLTELSATKNANILRTLPAEQQREAVNASIANRWTGIFPPKLNGATHAPHHESAFDRRKRINAECEARARAHFPEVGGGDVLPLREDLAEGVGGSPWNRDT
jgi:hypothetical protein